MAEYSEEELAGLTEAEREELTGADEDEIAALREVAGEDEEDSDDEEVEESAEDGAVAEGESGEDEEQAVAAEDDDAPQFIHRYEAPPVDGYEAKLQSLDEKFEAGEIALREYNAQRDELRAAQLKAEIAAESAAQEAEQRWKWEIDRFMDDHDQYKKDPILHAALDAAVKNLAADEANTDKTGRWFLREAHKEVSKRFGGEEQGDKPAEKTAEKQSQPRGKPDLKAVPRTLGQVPAAESNDTGGEFASLDRLDGADFEKAFARMTPDQQERYLKAG